MVFVTAILSAVLTAILAGFLGGAPAASAYAYQAWALRNIPGITVGHLTAISIGVNALIAFLGAIIIHNMLGIINRSTERRDFFDHTVAPVLTVVASVTFAITGPVRLISASYTPFVPGFVLMLLSVVLMFGFLRTEHAWLYRLANLCAGFTLAVAPAAIVLPFIYFALARQVMGGMTLKKLSRESGLFVAGGAIGGVCCILKASDNWSLARFGELIVGRAHEAVGAVSVYGWLVTIPLMLMLGIVVVVLVFRLTNEKQTSAFPVAALTIAGLVSLSQIAGPLVFRPWSWIPDVTMVNSAGLLAVLTFVSALGFAAGVGYYFIAAWCQDEEPADWVRKIVTVSIMLAVSLAFFSTLPEERKVVRLRNANLAFAEACATELKSVERAFVDPALVGALEYVFASRQESGPELIPVVDAGTATLRAAFVEKEHEKKPTAYQLGFDLWRREGRTLPRAGVFCAFEKAAPTLGRDVLGNLAKAARETFALKILPTVPPSDRELFLAFAWRMIRIARMRATQEIVAGQDDGAREDVALADDLESNHAPVQRVISRIRDERRRSLEQLSAREGLRLALSRADFESAMPFARDLIKEDPDDTDANFSLGMLYLTGADYASAIIYLSRALVRAPKEGAIYNNLAFALYKIGRTDDARAMSEKAIALMPKSPEVLSVNALIRGVLDRQAEESPTAPQRPMAETYEDLMSRELTY